MKNCLKTGMLRNLWKLREAATDRDADVYFGLASGFIDAAFSAQEECDYAAWDRMSKLAANAWRNRLKELRA